VIKLARQSLLIELRHPIVFADVLFVVRQEYIERMYLPELSCSPDQWLLLPTG
jgi:hypothetical protein